MSSLTFAFLWCSIQVTIVSLVTLVVMQVFLKRRPEISATIGAWSAAVALTLTLLIPVQLPEWFTLQEATSEGPAKSTRATNQMAHSDPESALDQHSAAASFTIPFDLETLVKKSAEFKNSSGPIGAVWGWYVVAGLCLGTTVCLARLILGLVLLRSLRRRAEVIQDCQLDALVATLLQNLNRPHQITFAQSAEVECAAVVGFVRPTILFSKQWTTWTRDELRTVLAHELSHVCRHDAIGRLVASVCSAIHFYNPLLRLLTERMVLAQELAADRLATRTLGEVKPYLRSLAQLAIRQDTGPCVRPQPIFTPVFSGHFMRRIEMLRAMDCEQTRSPRRWLSALVIVSIVMFGMTTTLMRCLAQTEATDNPESATFTSDSKTAAHGTAANQESQPVRFARDKLPASHPVLGKNGGLHLNVTAIRQSPLWAMLEATLKEMQSDELSNGWDLDAIDFISSDATISTLKNNDKDQDKSRDKIALGFTRALIRMNRDFDWKTEIQSQYPKCITNTRNGREYLEVNFLGLGPLPLRLQPLNTRELAGWIGYAPLMKGIPDPDQWHIKPEELPQPSWSDDWNAVSGGVLTVIFAPPKFQSYPSLDGQLGSEQYKTICEGVDFVLCGIDFNQDVKLAEAKVRFRCQDASDHQKILTAVEVLLKLYHSEMKKELDHPEFAIFNRLMIDAIGSAKTRVIEGHPNVIESQLRVAIPLELLKTLTAKAPTETRTR